MMTPTKEDDVEMSSKFPNFFFQLTQIDGVTIFVDLLMFFVFVFVFCFLLLNE